VSVRLRGHERMFARIQRPLSCYVNSPCHPRRVTASRLGRVLLGAFLILSSLFCVPVWLGISVERDPLARIPLHGDP
jgi:hypothetical protein